MTKEQRAGRSRRRRAHNQSWRCWPCGSRAAPARGGLVAADRAGTAPDQGAAEHQDDLDEITGVMLAGPRSRRHWGGRRGRDRLQDRLRHRLRLLFVRQMPRAPEDRQLTAGDAALHLLLLPQRDGAIPRSARSKERRRQARQIGEQRLRDPRRPASTARPRRGLGSAPGGDTDRARGHPAWSRCWPPGAPRCHHAGPDGPVAARPRAIPPGSEPLASSTSRLHAAAAGPRTGRSAAAARCGHRGVMRASTAAPAEWPTAS